MRAGTLRVLLVESDLEVSQAIARQLRGNGFEVLVVPSCAVTAALVCRCAVGIFDLDLADGDVVHVATEMLEDTRIEHVVFFSGANFKPSLARARRVGPVVPKSDGVQALIPIVEGVVGRKSPTVSMIVPSGADGEADDSDEGQETG